MLTPIASSPFVFDLPAVSGEALRWGLGVLAAAMILAWLLRRIVRRVLCLRGRGPSSADVFGRVASWIVIGFGVAAALTIVFPSVKPVNILGGVGVISIAAGIAFQTVLGNMFAGLVLLGRDRFRVGDQIGIRDHRGTVSHMGLTSTSVRTFDGRLVVFPNGVLHSEPVIVQTGFEQVRSTIAVDLDDTTDLDRAIKVALAAMRMLPQVLDDPLPQALLTEIGTDTVRMEMRFWSGARELDTKEATHAVIRRVLADFREEGVATGTDVRIIEAGEETRALIREATGKGAKGQ